MFGFPLRLDRVAGFPILVISVFPLVVVVSVLVVVLSFFGLPLALLEAALVLALALVPLGLRLPRRPLLIGLALRLTLGSAPLLALPTRQAGHVLRLRVPPTARLLALTPTSSNRRPPSPELG